MYETAKTQHEAFSRSYSQVNEAKVSVCDKSPVDMALERLQSEIETAHADAHILNTRLSAVLRPTPSGASGETPQTPSSCHMEDRLRDMANLVAQIGAQLRETRNQLCL